MCHSHNLTPQQQKLIDMLKGTDCPSIDELALRGQLPTSVLAAELMRLELKGLVQALPGKKFRLR